MLQFEKALFKLFFILKMSGNFFFFKISGVERDSHGDQHSFSLETVNFELLTLYQTAVHQEPADVLPLITLPERIIK